MEKGKELRISWVDILSAQKGGWGNLIIKHFFTGHRYSKVCYVFTHQFSRYLRKI